jgi:hypothetical protein
MGAKPDTNASSAEAVATGTGQVQQRERQHQADRQRRDRHSRQVPLVHCRGRQDRGDAAGRHPAPPVAHAGQVREHRAVRAEGLDAVGRDAADAVREHQHKLGPARRGGPGEQQADDQQRHRRAALAEDVALPGKQRREDEQALVAAAHRERRGAEPADRAWVPPRHVVVGRAVARVGWVHGREGDR